MDLHRIGYWQSEDTPDMPDPHVLVDFGWDGRERQEVSAYLSAGVIARTYLGVSVCRICGKKNGSLELTDGVYMWPEGLAHYVEVHSVRLPRSVVDHIERMLEAIEEATIDDSWWASEVAREARRER